MGVVEASMFPSERTPCSLDHRDRDQEGGGGDRAPVGLASWLDKFAGAGDPLVEQPGSCAAADGGARLVQANGEGVLEVACSDRAVAHGECAGGVGQDCVQGRTGFTPSDRADEPTLLRLRSGRLTR
jgi:hypothetical protein